MFTGIIEDLGAIREIVQKGSNLQVIIESAISSELQIDQSVAHNGVCLTVDDLIPGLHRVTVIEETLRKTNISSWQPGDFVNLERSLKMNGRLDGHIVQGHVDALINCQSRDDRDGSWIFKFNLPEEFATLVVEKGSIALNGISLTVFDVTRDSFCVGIIPYTFANTSMKQLQPGSPVNVEFDMVGKYINRIHNLSRH